MSTPAVSIVMPVYNGAAYLAEAVRSMLGQTFEDYEFVIVDDGSTDRTPRILAEFERQDRRIRVISRANTGIVGALNDGIAAAEAPLVARMDADDVSTPQRLHRQVAYLLDHPEVVVLGSRVIGTDPYGCM